MKKKTKKFTVKRTIFTSARPLKMSEIVSVSQVLGKLKVREEECKNFALSGSESQWAKCEAAIDDYGVFHEEAERTVRMKNRLPERKWDWKPRNSYPKWLKKMKKRRVTTCLGADGFKWASRRGVPKKVHKNKGCKK